MTGPVTTGAAALLMAMLGTTAHAAALEADDFAYGMPLTTAGNRAIHELALPAGVYRGVVDAGLRDMRVFNAAGESLPFRLQLPDVAGSVATELSLPFFPVAVAADSRGSDYDLALELDDSGRVTGIHSSAGAGEQTETVYIIDTSDVAGVIEQLDFELTSDRAAYVQRLRLDTSNDLNSWSTLQPEAALAQLKHDRQVLQRSSLSLERQPEDYLRLTWLGEAAVSLQGVSARIRNSAAAADGGGYRWQVFAGQRDARQGNVFHYDLGAFYPLTRVDLQYADNNTLALTRFESRPDTDSAWQLRAEQRTYRLQADELQIRSDAVPVDRRSHRYWRVTLDHAGTLSRAPQLRIGWLPHRLQFLARGEEPYLLAYGRHDPAGAGASDPLLLQAPAAATPGQAHAGETYTLGGESRLRATAAAPDWRQLSLWAVLLIAVFMLGGMALRLLRDMNERGDSH